MKIEQSMSEDDIKYQRDILIQRMMPQFAKMCEHTDKSVALIMTSSAWGDQPHEMELLGLAVKYACERGFSVNIVPFLTLEK